MNTLMRRVLALGARRFFLLTAASLIAWGQAAYVQTLPDITGTGATVQLASSGSGKWVQVQAASANSGTARCGDSSATSSRGIRVPAGGGMFYPPLPINDQDSTQSRLYNLSALYCYVANGDVITVAVGH